jgi:hypothetical protein
MTKKKFKANRMKIVDDFEGDEAFMKSQLRTKTDDN